MLTELAVNQPVSDYSVALAWEPLPTLGHSLHLLQPRCAARSGQQGGVGTLEGGWSLGSSTQVVPSLREYRSELGTGHSRAKGQDLSQL